ncbi:MAG: putative ATP-dependent endonuclease of OLD family [Candidatus Nitrosomirales archaeon]|jgi:predicted ATP-dependent endonuclease of OLD family
MRLTKFRVTKYRSIEHSGEVPVDENITTFVGINESGKTNLLRALRKLNNVTDTTFDDLTEHPMKHYGDFTADEPFIKATFSLDEKEQEEVAKLDLEYAGLKEVSFSKLKNMKLICHLKTNQIAIPFSTFQTEYHNPIIRLVESLDVSKEDDSENRKNKIRTLVNKIGKGIQGDVNVRAPEIRQKLVTEVEEVENTLKQMLAKTDFSPLIETINKIKNEIQEDSSEKVKNYLISKLPRFIYFENISVIDSRIHLPTFVEKIESDELDEDERTAKTLLDLVSLDAHELHNLNLEKGKEQTQIQKDKDRMSIICSLASKKLTDKLDKIWSQNAHSVEIEVNGNYLRVWVINRDDNVKLQLEERSRGYQWLFSFYVIFNAESEGRNKDAILLLDEPGLFLHAIGQKDFLEKVLPELSEKNQLIYTTHSPFMINMKRLDTLHTVTLNKNKDTEISIDAWASDKGALFPLQAALGYSLSQSMFMGQRQFLVEGVTDFWILSSASSILEAAGKTSLDKDLVITPAYGAQKTALLATMLAGQEFKVGVLLDSDREGELARDDLIKNKILKDSKVLFLSDITGNSSRKMNLEDIFPEDFYLKYVEDVYSKELNGKSIKLEKGERIVRRIEEYFEKNSLGKFNKSRPARKIMKDFATAKIGDLHPELITAFERMFSAINSAMKK